MINKLNQTKIESMIEVFCNYGSGFFIAYLTYSFIVMSSEWLRNSPFWVTALFTIISIIRSFYWRRFFNAEIHKMVHFIVFKWVAKIN